MAFSFYPILPTHLTYPGLKTDGFLFVFPFLKADMTKKFSFALVWKSLKDAFTGFGDDKVTKLSASLAYYTGFSLAPLLVVIIALCGFFFGREAIQGNNR